ncbi:GDP-mannose 4,6-dehydratase [Isosphaera pallida ATCC 43644]|jgi:GDPmannose 4,6-dehydratase|uniref:GDP-mannose 4,6-dehydratase n=1 Tax=Isosphaera pallida (strain ATCC 43644 / DSM 9630 / IS1B) TaxID=575540 RepID=E8R399_ISOPI|nr:GDP-mannose 4,6-dehydratase [Isosphaera pallida]ADV63609.1 GDP-mannose 4,6-dehydratase [Isosphaera pallida ATCC 43644]
MKHALITGITGQDGSYLAELLLQRPEHDYVVHGLVRRSSSINRNRIDHLTADPALKERFKLHYADLSDASSLTRLIHEIQPDEVYNLGAQSHVRVSFDQPIYTVDVVAVGTLRLLEAVRELHAQGIKPVKFYQASSSEMYGSAPPPQGPHTPFHPRSPYACAKLYAHYQTINYREAYGMFACSGILFNHESPRRGENFVTRKITLGAARIKEGLQRKLALGNLEAKRDWGFAGDYARAMWMMLQRDTPRDFVVATGETHSVREFLDLTFGMLGLDPDDFVEFDPRHTRPSEVDVLQGDPSEAREILGWTPKVDFRGLVAMMVEHDLELARREKYARSYIPMS